MSRIFDTFQNIDEDKRPDNRPNPFDLPVKQVDTILPGGTCFHVFELPYFDEELINKAWIQLVYTQGTETKLIKENNDFDLIFDEDSTYIKVKLEPEETRKFNDYNLDTKCQLRVMLIDRESGDESGLDDYINDNKEVREVIYSKVFKIRVLDTLLKEEIYKNEEK